MKNDSQFLFTSDEVTKNNLTKLGFSEIPSGGSFFIFINGKIIRVVSLFHKFMVFDKKKIYFL